MYCIYDFVRLLLFVVVFRLRRAGHPPVLWSSTSLVVVQDQWQDHYKTFRAYFQRTHSVRERPNNEYQFDIVHRYEKRDGHSTRSLPSLMISLYGRFLMIDT
jgi:hypothetical protein